MLYPTLEEVKKLSLEYRLIPVTLEMMADTYTPIHVFSALEGESENCFLLESAESAERWGRYSFIGINPKKQITVKNKTILISENGETTQITAEDPIAFIKSLLAAQSSPKLKNLPKFTGGLVGYFAYDMVRYYEKKLHNTPKDDLNMPDCDLLYCDEIIAFDHLKHKTMIIINIGTHGDIEKAYQDAEHRAAEIAAKIRTFSGISKIFTEQKPPVIKANITQNEFVAAVEWAKNYIVDGDIFQVVLSHRIEIDNPPSAFNTYRMLRVSNPSPYMYYFKMKDYQIAGSSPEMLVSVADREISSRPIAGTIRRGKTEKEDKELETELLSDKKEQAEHTMLVDLGRNDVGKVSQFGSVEITRFMTVEKYSQVMHLVSDVKGKLQEGKDAVDALTAVLPAGTLSGAPKVRAMEIIDELEKNRRGLYGGTVGYIGFDGDMDTCIAIRTVLYKNGKAYVQTGAGIVYDSVPEKEYLETESKAKAMIKAILEAGEL